MSFAYMGLTHCMNCGTSLDMNEHGLCSRCREEEEEKERARKKKQERDELKAEIVEEIRDDMLDISGICKMNTEEINVTIDVAKPKGSSYDDWYADIGYKIVELHKSGLDKVTLILKEGNEDDNEGNITR